MSNSLISRLPRYEQNNELAKQVLNATEELLNKTEDKVIQSENELDLDKMVDSIPIRERDLGLISNPSLTIQGRREIITARYRAVVEQTTDEAMKTVAESFGSGPDSVKIVPSAVDGIFDIKYDSSVGLPSNIYNAAETLDMIFPAHLGYRFAFKSNAAQSMAVFVRSGQQVTVHAKSRSDEFE